LKTGPTFVKNPINASAELDFTYTGTRELWKYAVILVA